MTKQNGFTLVELAIALMVIGLLIGGVLKGQELIDNARITAMVRQIKAYDAAALIFRNTYNALPGDIKRPNRIPNCTEEICTMPGNGDGKVDGTNASDVEMPNFFTHLTKAGMIQGPEGGDADEWAAACQGCVEDELFYPVGSMAPIATIDIFRAQSLAFWPETQRTNKYNIGVFSGKQSLAIDEKLDDGSPVTGDVRREEPADCMVDDDEASGEYNTSGTCYLFMNAGF